MLDVETEAGDTTCAKSCGKSLSELKADLTYFVVTEPQQQMPGASEALHHDL